MSRSEEKATRWRIIALMLAIAIVVCRYAFTGGVPEARYVVAVVIGASVYMVMEIGSRSVVWRYRGIIVSTGLVTVAGGVGMLDAVATQMHSRPLVASISLIAAIVILGCVFRVLVFMWSQVAPSSVAVPDVHRPANSSPPTQL